MKPGDHVQVTDRNTLFFGDVGKVHAIEKSGEIDIRFPGFEDRPIHYNPSQVKVVETPAPLAK